MQDFEAQFTQLRHEYLSKEKELDESFKKLKEGVETIVLQ